MLGCPAMRSGEDFSLPRRTCAAQCGLAFRAEFSWASTIKMILSRRGPAAQNRPEPRWRTHRHRARLRLRERRMPRPGSTRCKGSASLCIAGMKDRGMLFGLKEIDSLVVGAGQAGVAMSEHLGKAGIAHLVLERDRIAERWRTQRW